MSDRPPDSVPPPGEPTAPPPAGGLESTAFLLDRVRGGDAAARERLVARFLPPLRRWAAGRLPGYARATMDTDDLVQVSLLRALEHVEGFEVRREGAFLAYLRRILLNAVRDEIRRASRRPSEDLEGLDLADPAPSPLERQIGRDMLETYEDALTRLTEGQREAVIMRLEFGYSYPQIAEAMGRDANAARMLVARALVKLAEEMDEHRDG
jgi:RNA polymerase sigma-70 factor (ECF subfamily)